MRKDCTGGNLKHDFKDLGLSLSFSRARIFKFMAGRSERDNVFSPI